MERTLVTIGYEKATLPDVIARLQGAGVRHLVDVRAVAASRRAGFAKRALSAGLEEAGIAYTHLRALGTPREGRDAARAGRVGEMHAIYAEAMQAPEALDAFEALAVMVVEDRCALLCYEAEAHVCHRRLLTDRLADRLALTILDL